MGEEYFCSSEGVVGFIKYLKRQKTTLQFFFFLILHVNIFIKRTFDTMKRFKTCDAQEADVPRCQKVNLCSALRISSM